MSAYSAYNKKHSHKVTTLLLHIGRISVQCSNLFILTKAAGTVPS